MNKQTNLQAFLTDLYQGIASKRPGASRNPQNFRAEIESIKGGPPWDKAFKVIGTPASGETASGGAVIDDVVPSVQIVQPLKYFLGGIPMTASVAVKEIQNLTVTKGA